MSFAHNPLQLRATVTGKLYLQQAAIQVPPQEAWLSVSTWCCTDTSGEREKPDLSHTAGSRYGWAAGTDMERPLPAFEGAGHVSPRPRVSHTLLQLHPNPPVCTEHTRAVGSYFVTQSPFIRNFIWDVFQDIYFVWLGRTHELSKITAVLSSRKGRKM